MNNDDITTKPTIETVLERVNELGEQLTGQLTELRGEVAELRTGQEELRTDVAELRTGQDELRRDVAELRAGQVELRNDIADFNVGQRQLVRKVETLNANMLTLQTEHRTDMIGFERRLEKVESKNDS